MRISAPIWNTETDESGDEVPLEVAGQEHTRHVRAPMSGPRRDCRSELVRLLLRLFFGATYRLDADGWRFPSSLLTSLSLVVNVRF